MPHGGSEAAPRPHGALTAHLRTLDALHQSLFAPRFRALEAYGEPPASSPTLGDVIVAAKAAQAWHLAKELDVAAELAERRAAGGNSILIDEAARALAYHRAERERITNELLSLQPAAPQPQAAE